VRKVLFLSLLGAIAVVAALWDSAALRSAWLAGMPQDLESAGADDVDASEMLILEIGGTVGDVRTEARDPAPSSWVRTDGDRSPATKRAESPREADHPGAGPPADARPAQDAGDAASEPATEASEVDPSRPADGAGTEPGRPDAGDPEGPADSENGTLEYVVQPGDTLSSIARRTYGSDRWVRWLAERNDLADPDRLAVGAVLILPPLPE